MVSFVGMILHFLLNTASGMVIAVYTHPIEDGCPTLHADTLEHGQHGEADVVEGGDAVVGTHPLLQTD